MIGAEAGDVRGADEDDVTAGRQDRAERKRVVESGKPPVGQIEPICRGVEQLHVSGIGHQ